LRAVISPPHNFNKAMNYDGNNEPFLADEPPEDYDEDNDELDDAQGDAPARKRRVLFYTLEQKGKIVAEAYSQPRHVRRTARKYQVQPVQIRRWRAQLQQDVALPAYPYPRTVEERTIHKDHKRVKTRHEGRPSSTPEDVMDQLLPYIENLREAGNAVSTSAVTVELIRRFPELLRVGFVPLRRRVLRFLKRRHYTFRVVTHKAQNHRYHVMVIDGWVGYINRQIVASAYMGAQICNFDETNVDFDPACSRTLCKVGEKTVSLRISGHSGRCTVMLGCTASGFKFPPFVIWKGVRNGRIHRDCYQNVFAESNLYTVQPSGWMDGEAFQEWVHRVVTPYAHLHENKVYMALDQFSVHMQHNNTAALQQIGVEVEFIPPGYTSVLQVLDKGVHKPFKQYLREESMAFMLRNPEGTKPTRTDIALWIRNSWEQIQPTTILNTWESIGIRPMDH
jgi:transposase-like protein